MKTGPRNIPPEYEAANSGLAAGSPSAAAPYPPGPEVSLPISGGKIQKELQAIVVTCSRGPPSGDLAS